MKVFVTGGAGFIGSAMIRMLSKIKDIEIVNIDKLTYAANLDSLKNIPDSKYKLHKLDINDKNILDLFLEYKPDLLFHFAAESHVDNSIESPVDFINTNVLGTFNLLEAARKYLQKTGNKDFRFHHISTDEVYGDLMPHEEKFNEGSNYEPSSPYSASKASSDHLVRAWSRTYGLPVIITNCSNNYGPYQHQEKLIPKIIKSCINKEPIPIYGKGDQIRDWLFVDDHVAGIFLSATKGKLGETYVIGGDNEVTNMQIALKICKTITHIYYNNEFNCEDLITFVKDRPGHDMRYAINSSKIKNELGWNQKETFETGLQKTIEWAIANYE